MSERSVLEEVKSMNVGGRSVLGDVGMVQCGKQGLKRRWSFSDVIGIESSVKVEDHMRSELRHKVNTQRSIPKPWLAIQELRSGAPATPDVSCTQARNEDDIVGHGSGHGSDDGLCREALQGELHQRTESKQPGAEIRVQQHLTQVRLIQAELWGTTEEIKVARKQRDDAIAGNQEQLERQCDQVYEIEMRLQMELQKARRELLFVHQQRDDALKELESQSKHQQEQVEQIETELQGELQRTLEEIKVVRKQRDDAVAAKHVQLERQCDVVHEIEMGLQMELRRLVSELESARKEHEAAVLEVHLQQEHQHEQVLQIEMELQGKIQMKSEELKVVQKERDKAISDTHSLLDLQCDQVMQVEMQLQRDLQQVLDDLQSAQELPKQNVFQGLDHHLDQAREIEEALLLSREKLNCLKKQRSIPADEAKKPTPLQPRRGNKQTKAKSLRTPK